ncbi:MAG: beta-eliminating lyase-related protein [Acidobacteriota bacterium]
MSELSRRAFVGMTTLGGGLLAARPAAAARTERLGADFTGDGVSLEPAAYADLLARLVRAGGVAADEYSRGGAVEALEGQFANLLGKEAAVFMPSGTLANHLAVRTLSGARRRVIVQEISHLYNDSGDCAQQLSQINLIPLAPGKATFTWDEAARVLDRAASGRVPTQVGAIAMESPVRRLHGETFDFAEMQRICGQARARGIGLHLDGARLFVACAYSGRSPVEYAALFDTVYVSLWKCFNAAGGAILAGPRAALADLYNVRRMFGGALWNAWPYAAVARHYAEGYLERLTAAVRVSESLLERLSKDERFAIDRVPNGTSLFRLTPRTADLGAYRERLAARGVRVPAPDGGGFWLKVNETLAAASPEALAEASRSAL